jgi:hypothetical protein
MIDFSKLTGPTNVEAVSITVLAIVFFVCWDKPAESTCSLLNTVANNDDDIIF